MTRTAPAGDHRLPFAAFEAMLLSGALARAGAAAAPHAIAPRACAWRRADGSELDVEPVALAVGESFTRTWACARGGMRLGTGRFTHVECCTKTAPGQLTVSDRFVLGGGLPAVIRRYDVARAPVGIVRRPLGWQVAAAGVRGCLAGAAIRRLGGELRRADAALDAWLEAASPPCGRG